MHKSAGQDKIHPSIVWPSTDALCKPVKEFCEAFIRLEGTTAG